MFKTYGLCHLNIPVRDLKQSIRFYKGLFGMQEIGKFDRAVLLRTPGTHDVMTIMESPKKAETLSAMEGFHFGFRLTELIEINSVLEKVSEFGGSVQEHGGSKEKGRVWVETRDPDGYEVEIFWENR